MHETSSILADVGKSQEGKLKQYQEKKELIGSQTVLCTFFTSVDASYET